MNNSLGQTLYETFRDLDKDLDYPNYDTLKDYQKKRWDEIAEEYELRLEKETVSC